jgi:hypothetical protein
MAGLAATLAQAGFTPVQRQVVDICDTTPWSHRIYSYDFDVDAQGVAHMLYSKPAAPGYDRDDIFYAHGPVGGATAQIVEPNGKHGSISTYVVVNRTNGVAHLCYMRGQVAPAEELIHCTVTNGVLSNPTRVEEWAMHTRMQLDENGRPVFVRQGDNGLRLLTPTAGGRWTTRDIGTVKAARLADFCYDTSHSRFHVTYGDNAVPNGYNGAAYHKLWYTTSANGTNWETSLIDGSLTLWELEFWTSLVVDSAGTPYASMYKFNTYGGQYNTGTALLFARYTGSGAWDARTIAGAIPGGGHPDHRAGMGGQLAVGPDDRILGVWDNSPDHLIDYDGQYGNIVLQSSPDGAHWQYMQQLNTFSAESFCRVRAYGSKAYVFGLGDFHDTKLYLTEYDSGFPLWGDAYDLGSSWKRLTWFGTFADTGGWIYHMQHQWMYPVGTTVRSVWFYTFDMGWLWTCSTLYPWMYRYSPGGWLLYLKDTAGPRWFFNWNTQAWEPH